MCSDRRPSLYVKGSTSLDFKKVWLDLMAKVDIKKKFSKYYSFQIKNRKMMNDKCMTYGFKMSRSDTQNERMVGILWETSLAEGGAHLPVHT